jgi:hypothetical protein
VPVTTGFAVSSATHSASQFNREFSVWAQEVAEGVGSGNEEIASAKSAINRAIRTLNKHIWPHEVTLYGGIVLATGVDNYEVPFLTKAVGKCVQLNADGTDGFAYTAVQPVMWEATKALNLSTYTMKNLSADSRVYLRPIPVAAENGKSLSMMLWTRTPQLAAPDSRLLATPEFESVVDDLARYYFVQVHRQDNPSVVVEAQACYARGFAEYVANLEDDVDPNHALIIPG